MAMDSIDQPAPARSRTQEELRQTPLCVEGWKLVGVVLSLNAANGVAFVDLMGVTAILPAVSDHFTKGGTIAWAATTQLVGATVGLAVLGYLSDVWSRRLMLLIALGLLSISALACGLSHYQSRTDLFCALRTFSGIATGSISYLVYIAQNDVLSARKRLKYQGMQGGLHRRRFFKPQTDRNHRHINSAGQHCRHDGWCSLGYRDSVAMSLLA